MIDAKKLENELNNIPDGWIVLLETSAENVLEVSLVVLKFLSNNNYTGIVLSATRPYRNLIKLYKQNGIDTEKIFIIDCVSESYGGNLEESNNVQYIESVSALTSISISIDKVIGLIRGGKFLFIDSITTMLIHNEPGVFVRFIHSVMTRLRTREITGIIVSLSETDREIRAEIMQLCDRIINYKP